MDSQERARKPTFGPKRTTQSRRAHDQHPAAAVQPLPTSPAELPLTLGSLVGREHDRDELARLLDESRLVTLTGPGGVGKTRLALQLGSDLADRYPDGAWFVDAATVVEDVAFARAVASALKVPEQPGQSLEDTLDAHVRHRNLLVVLDNCEHLVTACVDLVRRLLTVAPRLSVLATSRERLNVVGEVVWDVKPLSVPPAGEQRHDRLAEEEAVRLFVERARAVRPAFSPDTDALEAIAEITRRLDGIPLAVELAAARVQAMSPAEIAARLDDRFALLVDGSRAAHVRHQTLRASLDWGYELLDAGEQALLRRVSVFSGGWTLEAVEEVCGWGPPLPRREVVAVLARLVAKSLVVADPGTAAMRYRLLDSIRVYAEERLAAADEDEEVREAHAERCLRLAERVRLDSSGGATAVMELLEPEFHNMRAALSWTISSGRTEAALDLAAALTPLWQARGSYTEGLEWLERGLAETEGRPSPARARALRAATSLAFRTSRFPLAARVAEEAAESSDDAEPRERAGRLKQLGFVQLFTRGPDAALPLFEDSVAVARQAGDSASLGDSLHACGRAHLFRGDLRAAQACFTECQEVLRGSGDPRASAALLGLGWTAMVSGDHRSAEVLLSDALVAVEQAGEKYDTALTTCLLGELAGMRDDLETCRAMLERSLSLARAIRAPFPLVRSLSALGKLELVEGNLSAAREFLDEAVQLGREVGFGYLLVRCLHALGEVRRTEGDGAAACWVFEEAVELAEAWGDSQGLARSKFELARQLLGEGDETKAVALHHEALALYAEVGDVAGASDSLVALACLAGEQGRFPPAIRLFAASRSIREAHGVHTSQPEMERRSHERELVRAREAMGDEAFDAAWAEGAGLALDGAVAYAQRSRGRRRRPVYGWGSLTPAEREIVALVEQGMTNAEIAEQLFVSPKTVRNHLSNVFAKLGVSNRLELAKVAWREAE